MKRQQLASIAGFTLEAEFADYLASTMSVLWAGDVKRSNGKGPRMRNMNGGLVIADYLVAGQSIRGWIDCKAKSTYGKRGIPNRPEQLLDKSAWDAYLELLSTGTNVYLCIIEVDTSAIFMADMRTLQSGGNPIDDELDGRPVVRFDRRQLTWVGNWEVPENDLRKTRFDVKWEIVRSLMHQLPLEFAV